MTITIILVLRFGIVRDTSGKGREGLQYSMSHSKESANPQCPTGSDHLERSLSLVGVLVLLLCGFSHYYYYGECHCR